MEQEQIKAQGVFDYYTARVNNAREQDNFREANEWLDMLLGAMAMYDALNGTECMLDVEDGKIYIKVYED